MLKYYFPSSLQYLMRLVFLLGILLGVSGPAVSAPIPAPPSFDAKSYILLGDQSGEVLAEHNADNRLEPASITKLMTAYVVFKALAEQHVNLGDNVLVSEKAWRMEGSRMFIEVDKRVKLDDLLKGMIVQSGNDASVALAEHVAGSEEVFVNMMNAEALTLNLTNTQYRNSTGLPSPEHYTTARDIALLSRAIIHDFPDQYVRYSEREFIYNGIRQNNRNKLLWRDDSVDGLKTGFTDSAGYCLASSAKKGEMRLIAVVMGVNSAKARVEHSQALLNWGFRFFETYKLYASGQKLTDPRVWKGELEYVALGVTSDIFITIPKGQYDVLNARLELTPNMFAPIKQGQQYGEVIVALDGKDIRQEPLVALNEVPEGGLWRQTVDTVLQWLD